MKFILEVDDNGRISVNGIRFSKRMTLEEVIEEMQEEAEEVCFDEDEQISDEEYVEGYNPSTGRFEEQMFLGEEDLEYEEEVQTFEGDEDADSDSEPIYFDGIIDDL